MTGIESPLPPFYAPPKLNMENIKNGEIFSWAFWNTLYVFVTPVKTTVYIISTLLNKFAGTPIASRDVQPEKADLKVNPNYVNMKTPAENTPRAASCDHSSVTLEQKVSTRPDGLSQPSSQAVAYQIPVQISKQSQHQYAQQRDEPQESQSEQRVDEINERNFNRSLNFSEHQMLRGARRILHEEPLAEQDRSRDRSQTEQALLQQESDISVVEDIQSTQRFQMDDEAYYDYQLAQHEREDIRLAYQQSLLDNEVQQQDVFDPQQTQQAILSSIQQSFRGAPVDVPELVVQLPEAEEDGVSQTSYHPLCDSITQQQDVGQGTQRPLQSSNIQQQDISDQHTPQATLDSPIQQLPSVTPAATPIPVVQLPLRTVLEHIVHENKGRKRDQKIDIDNDNVREKLRDKEEEFAKNNINVSQISEEAIKQFISGWQISRDEFYRLYRSIPDPEIVLKLARELVEHIEKELLAQEQEARLAKEVAEAAKLAAKDRLVDAPPESHDGIFSIRFQTGGQKITRRFWPSDTVQSIFDFAHINGYPPSAFIFVVDDFPGHRRILDEPSLPLSELQMTNRFVVRIEEKE